MYRMRRATGCGHHTSPVLPGNAHLCSEMDREGLQASGTPQPIPIGLVLQVTEASTLTPGVDRSGTRMAVLQRNSPSLTCTSQAMRNQTTYEAGEGTTVPLLRRSHHSSHQRGDQACLAPPIVRIPRMVLRQIPSGARARKAST